MPKYPARRFRALILVAIGLLLAPLALLAQRGGDEATLARIRAEGLERSMARSSFLTLTDNIGARLTGSPAHVRSANWARERFEAWGLANARLEPFEFGAGWEVLHVSAAMTEPRYFPLIVYPEAWTSSTAGAITGRIVYIGDKTSAQVTEMGAALKGAIVLTHPPVETFVDGDRPQPGLENAPVATGNPALPQARAPIPGRTLTSLLQQLGAAVTIKPSTYRDGTVGVLGNRATPREAVPSLVVATEQYNMLARLAAAGEPVAMTVESRTQFHETDLNSYNVIAEIPGTDPAVRDQHVLIGAHLDSWHTASGATDNADGVAAVMEAMRILKAIGAAPRRTIRVALWSGEEQGLLGARAYLAQHLATPEAQAKLQVYLNDDPGSGRTLGFYMEKNEAAKQFFDGWLAPFKDLGATMNVMEGIGSTDHVPFVQAGMPAFNAIKDFSAYDERTRHTNADFPERMSEDELKQQAIIMASFAWHAAQMDGRIPRLPSTAR
ncbi:MAG: M20/M25/M40 family metallo-hydrolase [Vicinamibacterales bacterium]